MAEIRCPHCGKENPDFLDVCQFCQNPLKPESKLRIGENPTKKNTGELENVLPDWLKDARKQARDSAEEEAAQIAAQPKIQKDEPVDLLAGLFKSESSEDEDVPDWLAAINPTAKNKPTKTPSEPAPETDFFAQFNKSEPAPAERSTPSNEPAQPAQSAADRDQLSEWFIQASEQPAETLNVDDDAPHSDWGISESFSSQRDETPAAKEEEDLSWLHNLESVARQTDELKSPKQTTDWGSGFDAPTQGSGDEDLSWLNQLGAIPAPEQPASQPPEPSQQKEDLRWLDNLGGTSSSATPESSEDLSWLNNLGGTPLEPPASKPSPPKEDLSWLNAFSDAPETSKPAEPQPSAAEDLSWLNDLGDTAAELPAAQPEKPEEDLSWLKAFSDTPETSQPPATQAASTGDLNWLNNLGGTPIETPSAQHEKPQEDLGWLNAFSSEAPEPSQPATSQPAEQEDLSWLSSLGGTPVEQPSEPEKSQEDLSWLNAFGSAAESSQPASAQPSSQEDLSWLNSLQGESDTLSSTPFTEPADEAGKTADIPHVSPFVPRKTAPLDEGAEASIPDWLKNAAEGPSMPMGTEALDQFREDYKVPSQPEEPFSWKSFTQEAKPEEQSVPPKSEPAFFDESLFASTGTSAVPSTEDVNSLFSMEMPDWLSQAEPTKESSSAQDIGIHAEGGEALAPVDLPSWVQAMRPVDAAISEAAPSIEDQPAEREGPLAGLRGVLPVAPLGSARRPKPISLKLQSSDEQQASAAILEQLLVGETSPRPLVSVPVLGNQRVLRWVLAGLFWVVLSVIIFMRSEMMPVSADLLSQVDSISQSVQLLPDNSSVLVVVDYEPSLSGELEASGGPLLKHIALLRHPNLSFVVTSPTSSALVDRLINKAQINDVLADEFDYVSGKNYFNLGYLAGGESGVLSFVQAPRTTMPTLGETVPDAFSGYSAVILLTDRAESARTWIEQLQAVKQANPAYPYQPLFLVSSAQAGPLLQPYVSSGQANGLVTGVADAARYEYKNALPTGTARSYWDALSVGLIMAVVLIAVGSLWSIFAGIRARRAEATEG